MRPDFEMLCEFFEGYADDLEELLDDPRVTGSLKEKIRVVEKNLRSTSGHLYRICEELPEEDELETEVAVKQYMKDKLTEDDLSYLRLKFGMEAHEIYAI